MAHRTHLLRLALGLLLLAPGSARATVIAGESSAFGLFVDLAVPVLPDLVVPETPSVAGAAPAPYDLADAIVSIDGSVVDLGLLEVTAASDVDGGAGLRFAEADAGLKTVSVEIPSVLSLELSALTAEARSEGDAGALGSFGGAVLGSLTLALGGSVVFDDAIVPAANTDFLPGLLDPLGIDVLLNEQIPSGDGITTTGIVVNALHVWIDKPLLSGEIILSHAESQLVAAVPEPGAPLLLAAVLGSLAAARAASRPRRAERVAAGRVCGRPGV